MQRPQPGTTATTPMSLQQLRTAAGGRACGPLGPPRHLGAPPVDTGTGLLLAFSTSPLKSAGRSQEDSPVTCSQQEQDKSAGQLGFRSNASQSCMQRCSQQDNCCQAALLTSSSLQQHSACQSMWPSSPHLVVIVHAAVLRLVSAPGLSSPPLLLLLITLGRRSARTRWPGRWRPHMRRPRRRRPGQRRRAGRAAVGRWHAVVGHVPWRRHAWWRAEAPARGRWARGHVGRPHTVGRHPRGWHAGRALQQGHRQPSGAQDRHCAGVAPLSTDQQLTACTPRSMRQQLTACTAVHAAASHPHVRRHARRREAGRRPCWRRACGRRPCRCCWLLLLLLLLGGSASGRWPFGRIPGTSEQRRNNV